ncbi:MAG: hypothetical protein C0594_15755 [Marinilabiliales bacterium]|nr:MAG: hypothetical protein C0594_15755 [Marinilabiliales bacterium]
MLDANYYSGLNGYWIDTVPGQQIFYDDVHTNTDTLQVSQYGLHQIIWVLENGIDFDGTPVCRDSSESVYLYFHVIPEADAGADFTACGLSAELNAESTADYGVWSSNNSDAIFHYNDTVTAELAIDSVTIDAYSYDMQGEDSYGNAADYWEFYWQEDSGWDIANFECSDIDTLRIIFAKRPSANFFYKIPPCYGDTAQIWADMSDDAIVDPNQAVFEWNWGDCTDTLIYGNSDTTGSGVHTVSWATNCDESDTYLIPGEDSLYHVVTLRVTNQYSCVSFERKDTIREPKPLSPEITVTDATCSQINGCIDLNTDNNTYTFYWLDGRISDPTDTTVCDLEGGDNGNYLLQITAKAEDQSTYPNYYCVEQHNIYVPDTGEVTAFFDTTGFVIGGDGLASYDSIVPAEIIFRDLSSDAARNWKWRFYDQYGDLVTVMDSEGNEVDEISEQNPTVTFMEPGLYMARLIVTSREDCEDIYEYSYILIVAESDLELPNIFSPNGDGINDVFLPKMQTIETLHGVIFNRWGKKVYEWTWNDGDDADPVLQGWDGSIHDGGRKAAPGVYFYLIEATGMDGVEYGPNTGNCSTCKGTVTLVGTKDTN